MINTETTLIGSVAKIVERWRPAKHRGWPERRYRDQLLIFIQTKGDSFMNVEKSKFLTDRVRRPDIRITAPDDNVQEKELSEIVYVELKLNLASHQEYNRLMLQIYDILKRPEPPTRGLIVGLIGDTNPLFFEKLLALEGENERPRIIKGNRKFSRRLRVLSIPLE